MTYSERFVINNDLQPADAILVKKKFMGMLNHYAVYLGRGNRTNRPVFAANYTGGVKIISEADASVFLQKLEPRKIDRFYGNEGQRSSAVRRALSEIGRTSYNLIFSNCEHYKNFVQFGHKYSKQVEVAGNTPMIAGGATVIAGLASKNDKAALIGLFLFAIGAIVSTAAEQDD